MLLDSSILDLEGSLSTPISDLIIYLFDADFGEEVEMPTTTKLQHLQRNLIVRLRGKSKSGIISIKTNFLSVSQYTQKLLSLFTVEQPIGGVPDGTGHP